MARLEHVAAEGAGHVEEDAAAHHGAQPVDAAAPAPSAVTAVAG